MKIAIIGVGKIAQKAYFPLLKIMEDVQIDSVMGRSRQSVEKAQARWSVSKGFTNLSEVIESHPDACLVLAATSAHFQIASELLNNGLDVYLEKPATVYSADAKMLAELAKEKSRVLMVGYNRRYADFFVQAKSYFKTSEIQQISLVKSRRNEPSASLFTQYLDDTIHQIDLLRFFDPAPKPLRTDTNFEGGKLQGAISLLRLSSGGLATIHTFLDSGAWQESVLIQGAGKTVMVNAFRDLIYTDGDGIQVFGPEQAGKWKSQLVERGVYGEVQHFLDCVRTRQTPQTDGFEAYKTQLLAEQLTQLAGESLEYVDPYVR
jgi:virulence factor